MSIINLYAFIIGMAVAQNVSLSLHHHKSIPISPYSITALSSIDDRFICIGTRNGELHVYDKVDGKITYSANTYKDLSMSHEIDGICTVRYDVYIQIRERLYRYHWEPRGQKEGILVYKNEVVLHGEKVLQMWATSRAAYCLTTSRTLYHVEETSIKDEGKVSITQLVKRIPGNKSVASNDHPIWIVSRSDNVMLYVYSDGRMKRYSLTTLALDREYSLPDYPYDVTEADGCVVVVYNKHLLIINRNDRQMIIKLDNDYRRVTCISGKKAIALWNHSGDLSLFSTEGIASKAENLGAGIADILWDGKRLYAGLGAYNNRDEAIGGSYLKVFEVNNSPR